MLRIVRNRDSRFVRESVPGQLCNSLLHNCPGERTEGVWADPTRISPLARCSKFVASLSQIAPIVPVLPSQPTRKCCAVYNLRFELFHGMEEVIGWPELSDAGSAASTPPRTT